MELIEGALGALVMAGAGIVSIIGMIYLIYRAFTVTWYWGFITLLVPGGFIPFTVCHWQTAKKPFLMTTISLAVAVGTFVVRSALTTFVDGPSI